MAEETNNPKQANEVPSTVEQQAPSVAEDNATSTSEPKATDIPTANAPDPEENLVENPEAAREKGTSVVDTPKESDLQAKSAEKPGAKKAAASPKREGTADKASDADSSADESTPAKPGAKKAAPPKGDKPAAAAKAKGDKPAAAAKEKGDKPAAAKAAKKEKPPAVEDKPFAEFMQQDYLPALQKAFTEQGLQGIDVTFKKQNIPVVGYEQDECWQVIGHWQNAPRQFNIYFPEEDIKGAKFFSCNEGSRPSTLEHFLGDERRISLDLMIYGVMQRLNGQKWLARN